MRAADIADLDAVWTLIVQMHTENGVLALDESTALTTVRTIVESGQALVSTDDTGKIVASLGLVYGQPCWYSTDKGLVDRWFYVHPDHRGEAHMQNLILTAKKMARIADVPLFISVAATKKPVKKMLFLEKYMRPFGGAFLYQPEADVL
jgi:hypothetical protein